MPKLYSAILSTTHLDSHNEQMSLDALESFRDVINSDRKVRWGIDHNREFPPLGRLANATIEKKNGHHYLKGDYYGFDESSPAKWDSSLIVEKFHEPAPFVEVENEMPFKTVISVDRNSFSSKNAYLSYINAISGEDYECEHSEHLKKAYIPSFELIFTVASSSLLAEVLKPLAKKVGKKVIDSAADLIVEQGKRFLKFVHKCVVESIIRTPNNKPIYVVFELYETPNIELIVKTRDPNFVLKGLQMKKLEAIKIQIDELSKHVNIAKIQFKLDEKTKWKFTYLLTEEGASIGKAEVFRKRDKRFSVLKMKNNGKIANSMGGRGTQRTQL